MSLITDNNKPGRYLEVCIPRHQDFPFFVCPVNYDLDQSFQRGFDLACFFHEPEPHVCRDLIVP